MPNSLRASREASLAFGGAHHSVEQPPTVDNVSAGETGALSGKLGGGFGTRETFTTTNQSMHGNVPTIAYHQHACRRKTTAGLLTATDGDSVAVVSRREAPSSPNFVWVRRSNGTRSVIELANKGDSTPPPRQPPETGRRPQPFKSQGCRAMWQTSSQRTFSDQTILLHQVRDPGA